MYFWILKYKPEIEEQIFYSVSDSGMVLSCVIRNPVPPSYALNDIDPHGRHQVSHSLFQLQLENKRKAGSYSGITLRCQHSSFSHPPVDIIQNCGPFMSIYRMPSWFVKKQCKSGMRQCGFKVFPCCWRRTFQAKTRNRWRRSVPADARARFSVIALPCELGSTGEA